MRKAATTSALYTASSAILSRRCASSTALSSSIRLSVSAGCSWGCCSRRWATATAPSKSCARARALQPDSAEITSALSIALIEKGAADEAMALLKAWLEDHDDDVTARVNLGTALLQKGELDAAVNVYRDLAQRAPSNAVAAYNLGMALKQKDDFGPAETELKRAIALDPTLPDAPYTLGVIYWQTGRAEEAAASFRAATVVRPDYAEAHSMLATVLVQQGDNDEALSEVREAVRLAPGLAEAQLLPRTGPAAAATTPTARAPRSPRPTSSTRRSPTRRRPPSRSRRRRRKRRPATTAAPSTGSARRVQLMPDNAEAHWQLAELLDKRGDSAGAREERTEAHPPRALFRPQRAAPH